MTSSAQPTHPSARFVSVRLITEDVGRLVAFYEQLTGAPARWSTPDFAEVPTSVGTLAIASTRTVPSSAAGSAQAGSGAVIVEFLVADVDAERSRLEGVVTDVVQEPTTMPWGNRSLLLRDPDGTLVNVFTPVTSAAVARSGS